MGNIERAIRDEIERGGWTGYALSKASGVAQSGLSRFMRGERSLKLNAVEKLLAALELEVVKAKPANRRKGK